MTATAPRVPPPVDAAHDPHLSGLFEPVIDEIDAGDLDVVGELPAEMDGMYLRNGPNPRFTPLGSYVYPLEGDGMVHGLWVSGGKARYANRFVRTPALETEEAAGHALWGGLMTGYTPGVEEVGPSLAGTFKDMPDLVPGDHDAILWLDTSTGRSVQWDAGDLAVGEPCFVPRPGDDDTTHGWWTTFAVDRTDRSSWLISAGRNEGRPGCVVRSRGVPRSGELRRRSGPAS